MIYKIKIDIISKTFADRVEIYGDADIFGKNFDKDGTPRIANMINVIVEVVTEILLAKRYDVFSNIYIKDGSCFYYLHLQFHDLRQKNMHKFVILNTKLVILAAFFVALEIFSAYLSKNIL